MKISSYIDLDYIFTDIDLSDKNEIIREIIKKIGEKENKILEDNKKIENEIIKKEEDISTAIGNGIVIPHIRCAEYDDFIVAVGLLKNSIEVKTAYNNLDKVKYFFVIISAISKNKLMLKLIPEINKLFLNKEFRVALEEKKIEKEDFVEIIKKYERESSDGLEAEDIMRKEILPVKVDDIIGDVVARMAKDKIDAIPVVDNTGKFLGDITEEEIIMYSLPKSAAYLRDLDFLRNSEQFEQYFKNEKKLTIGEIYEMFPAVTVKRNSSVVEVAFVMTYNKVSRVYVVENEKYLGTVYRNDIIRKVLHI